MSIRVKMKTYCPPNLQHRETILTVKQINSDLYEIIEGPYTGMMIFVDQCEIVEDNNRAYVKVQHEHMVYYILTTNCAFVRCASHTELMQNATYAVNLNTNNLEKCREHVTTLLDKALFNF